MTSQGKEAKPIKRTCSLYKSSGKSSKHTCSSGSVLAGLQLKRTAPPAKLWEAEASVEHGLRWNSCFKAVRIFASLWIPRMNRSDRSPPAPA